MSPHPDYRMDEHKRVLVFRPGHPAEVEEMDAFDWGVEQVWIYRCCGGYLRADFVGPNLVLFRRDAHRLRENRVLESGEVVEGTAVLVAVEHEDDPPTPKDWPKFRLSPSQFPRRSLTDAEVAQWSTLEPAPENP